MSEPLLVALAQTEIQWFLCGSSCLIALFFRRWIDIASIPALQTTIGIFPLGACPSIILDGALTGWFNRVMSKRFRSWDVDQGWLLPASVHDFVAPDHLAHFCPRYGAGGSRPVGHL